MLVDHAQRGRYHDWLREKLPELRTVWAVDPAVAQAAAAMFARGQRSLGDGDVHRAMSELAAACRQFPGHPEYEASLAWARYRVQVGSGRDRIEAAVAERAALDDLLLGCRPWPRALVALAPPVRRGRRRRGRALAPPHRARDRPDHAGRRPARAAPRPAPRMTSRGKPGRPAPVAGWTPDPP